MPLERNALLEARWKYATAAFGLFVACVIVAADIRSPLLDIVRYLPASDFTGHMVLIGTLAFLAGGWSPAPKSTSAMSNEASNSREKSR